MRRSRGRRLRSGPMPVDRALETPLWEQVHADLVRRVRVGDFTDEFPGELTLVEEYAVSRHTVREALRRLREAGVVSGERGRTSRLTGPAEIDQPMGTLYSLFAAVGSVGQSQRSLVRAQEIRADAVVAERLGLEGSTPLFYLARLRLAGDSPLALDRVWLPASVAEPLLDADFTETALYDELRLRCGVTPTGGSEHLRAVVPTRAERLLLEMPAGVAALAIERSSFDGPRALEWRHTLVRGDRFAVSAEFSQPSGYRLAAGSLGES